MSANKPTPLDKRWVGLQNDLRDIAFVLDRQGSHEAADLACTIATRIGELLSGDGGREVADLANALVARNPA